jgi:predicted dinucleotide-binding enzyme
MAYIVSIGAGEKGRVALQQWLLGAHETDEGTAHLADAEFVLLDIHGAGVDLAQLAPSLAGKVVIDCSNPANVDDLRSQPSGAAEIARLAPSARVVKALNVIGSSALVLTCRQMGAANAGTYTSAYYCGDDADAKQMVAGLLGELGLEPIDCGPLANAPLLESLGLLTEYVQTHLFQQPFAFVIARQDPDRSPLDSWL